MRASWLCVVAIIGTSVAVPALATPPDHAPAHGWRKKNDPQYVGYGGRRWDRDFAVLSGRCNREEIGAVLGGVAGGVIGRSVADSDDRVVGTIVGAAIGALIGAKIGRDIDQGDRACIGHALEIGVDGRAIVWSNAATGVHYELTPRRGKKTSKSCRDFTLVVVAGGERLKKDSAACQSRPGVWEIRAA